LLEESVLGIAFRPHHFLCALCFQGKGYSPEFIANFSTIMQYLNSEQGDDVIIEVVAHTDSICDPCPSKREKKCVSQKKILRLDEAHATILAIQSGEKITWGEAKKRIRKNMTLEKFHVACAPCEWKKLGICEKVLMNF
jgi:hypothetical protein